MISFQKEEPAERRLERLACPPKPFDVSRTRLWFAVDSACRFRICRYFRRGDSREKTSHSGLFRIDSGTTNTAAGVRH